MMNAVLKALGGACIHPRRCLFVLELGNGRKVVSRPGISAVHIDDADAHGARDLTVR
jgi:hypothetical protein